MNKNMKPVQHKGKPAEYAEAQAVWRQLVSASVGLVPLFSSFNITRESYCNDWVRNVYGYTA